MIENLSTFGSSQACASATRGTTAAKVQIAANAASASTPR